MAKGGKYKEIHNRLAMSPNETTELWLGSFCQMKKRDIFRKAAIVQTRGNFKIAIV